MPLAAVRFVLLISRSDEDVSEIDGDISDANAPELDPKTRVPALFIVIDFILARFVPWSICKSVLVLVLAFAAAVMFSNVEFTDATVPLIMAGPLLPAVVSVIVVDFAAGVPGIRLCEMPDR